MTLPARLYVGGRRVAFFQGRRLPDIVAGSAAVIASMFLSWPLFTAKDLDTGAGDWPAHAFRVREVMEHGLTSWSHAWAGGMPLWEGYQAVPHLVTAVVTSFVGAGVTQAMTLMAGLMLLLLRVGMYYAGRALGASPVAALVGALTFCLLDSVHQPVANFSELWGLALAPLFLAVAYRWSGRPAGLIVGAAGGLAIEVHPHLAVVVAIGLVAAFAVAWRERSTGIFVAQGVLFVAGAAVFWLPVVVSARPAYIEPYFVSVEFARLLLSLATAGFLPAWPVIAAAVVFAGVVEVRRWAGTAAISYLLLCGLGITVAVAISLLDQVPDLIRTAQLTRLIGIAPVLIGLLIAVLLTFAIRQVDGQRQAWATAFALFAVSLAVGQTRSHPTRDVVLAGADPIVQMIAQLDKTARGRVMADPVLTAAASSAGGGLRYAASYSGRDWSILGGPAQFYLGEYGSPTTRAAYLIVHGVEYLVVPSGVRPAIADPANGTSLMWRSVDSAEGFDLLQAPWRPVAAWHLPRTDRIGLTIPDADFRDTESAYVRDVVVGRLAEVATREANAGVSVAYPDDETIVVTVTDLEAGRYLVVNENWGQSWTATVNGERRPVERFGANHIGIDLKSVRGEATVVLRHGWPTAQMAGLILSLASVPVAVVLCLTLVAIRKRGMLR